jgi:hypothetical protein
MLHVHVTIANCQLQLQLQLHENSNSNSKSNNKQQTFEYNFVIGILIIGAAPFQGFQSLEFGCGVELVKNGPCLSVPAVCERDEKIIRRIDNQDGNEVLSWETYSATFRMFRPP